VMMDSNGCNTTAAAAVAAAGQHFPLNENTAVVLGGTGPVGHRVAQLLAMEGADVTLVSRGLDRAEQTCRHIRSQTDSGTLRPAAAAAPEEVTAVCQNATMVFAAGAAGVCFLPEGALQTLSSLRIAVDLNAVPPVGIADISVTDKAAEKHGTLCYGAIGVGGLKMKVHRRAVASLFESNDRVLTTAEIYQLARQLLSNS
ncbi:MAG: bifunctional NADP-dependent methylenetetrahydromethanopterin dehydrogenase/methylenetetrahydrofolate dehydrogenase, partial [Planctomycetaceae bacterium]|nr:bifunctional NADP-dependent methylenetetrahydromethanopterin dehydrogenase/methylenetetrahydrofolate dehydrogenase [Planctomycetaceae bacterium]